MFVRNVAYLPSYLDFIVINLDIVLVLFTLFMYVYILYSFYIILSIHINSIHFRRGIIKKEIIYKFFYLHFRVRAPHRRLGAFPLEWLSLLFAGSSCQTSGHREELKAP